MNEIRHWVDNKPYEKTPERWGDVFNPAIGLVASRVAMAGVEDVDAAVQSAKDAFETWRDTSISRRATILFAFRELLERNKEEIAKLLVAEHGKVMADALGEVQRVVLLGHRQFMAIAGPGDLHAPARVDQGGVGPLELHRWQHSRFPRVHADDIVVAVVPLVGQRIRVTSLE